MISPYFSQSSGFCSVVKPSSASLAISRVTGSVPAGDSIGFSAFGSCIFVDQTNQIGEFKRFAHVVIGSTLTRFLRQIAVSGENDIRNAMRFLVRFECAAKLHSVHSLSGEIG